MIDLSLWNLTVPAGAKVIPTKALNAGYTDQFFVRQSDGALIFIAPSSGENIKSTKNSTYPRSELRETLANGDDKEANWKAGSADLHSIEATLSVDELPASKKAIIGQIHGDGNHPPLKIQITGTTIYAQLRRKLDGTEDKPKLLTGYKLGEQFTYRAEVSKDGKAKFFINGQQVVNDTLPADGYQFDMASYANDTWYFKAGVYSQEKVGGTGVGRTTFSALTVCHGAAAVPVTTVATPATTLADQITDAFNAWQAGTVSSHDTLVALNALSKQVASLTSDKDRAPLYAQINQYKAQVQK
ncbi:polysaccharide lyase family 7 protein [Pseudomonas typographi]|uniref:Polysaccharide lyase family 7 protein n=1 Tax=Pseudomonas typographi TaxID=2715964 RepID=A0ABR7Z5T6_9PSED|nr:polysaccharide lyase family 7 protein [Pseudomonas typographi]MBD1600881.1 polysaccharide lyase family 7 protein [Pseudomonas typographi]